MKNRKALVVSISSIFLWVNTVSAEKIPNLNTDDFKKDSHLISVGYSNVVLNSKVIGTNTSGSAVELESEYKNSYFNLSHQYAVSNKLSIGISIPYQLSSTDEGEVNIGNTERVIRSEGKTGIDDISIEVIYRFLKDGALRQAVEFSATFDNADDSEGQLEIKDNGIVVQELEKEGQGNGYRRYSLNYNIGIVRTGIWGVELSPYFTYKENSGNKEPGNSYGFTLSERYQIDDTLKALFGLYYGIESDSKYGSTEYKSYTFSGFGAGIVIAIKKQNQIGLSYIYSSPSRIEVKNSDLVVKRLSGSSLSIAWTTLF